MKLWDYWQEIYKDAKARYELAIKIVGYTSIAAITYFHLEPVKSILIDTYHVQWVVFCLYVVWVILWLPFKKRESDRKIHQAEKTELISAHTTKVQELQIQIHRLQKELDEGVDLQIKGEMFFENKEKMQIILSVKVVNNGRRVVRIQKVATILQEQDVFMFGRKMKTESSEITLSKIDHVKDLAEHGGSWTWQVVIKNNPHFKFVERDGLQWGEGYVMLTSEKKVPFEFKILPDSDYILYNSYTP